MTRGEGVKMPWKVPIADVVTVLFRALVVTVGLAEWFLRRKRRRQRRHHGRYRAARPARPDARGGGRGPQPGRAPGAAAPCPPRRRLGGFVARGGGGGGREGFVGRAGSRPGGSRHFVTRQVL